MPTYANGYVPTSVVSVVLAAGRDSQGRVWEHRLTPAMAARWKYARAYAKGKWGTTMGIKAGANAYRDIVWQRIGKADACAQGNCNAAATPGYSSHGGNWQGRDCLAIDVDPGWRADGSQIMSWGQVWEACTAAGFSCGLITSSISGVPGGEPWHVIDFHAFGSVPAYIYEEPFPTTPEPEKEEEAMSYSIVPVADTGGIDIVSLTTGLRARISEPSHVTILQRTKKNDANDPLLSIQIDIAAGYIRAVNPPPGATVDVDALAAALGDIDETQDADVVRAAVAAAITDNTQYIADATADALVDRLKE